MGTSRFDRQPDNEGNLFSSPSGRTIPADFSEEDFAFVEELNTLFVPENEELPPYFAQTLLQPEDPRFQPVEHGFEHKTSARVFRRLKLHRRLFSSRRSSLSLEGSLLSALPARRSLLATAAVLMLVMLFTVAFTSPSFALGMQILLQGARSGIYQVHSYPHNILSPANKRENTIPQPKEINLLAVQPLLHFPMYWPQAVPDNYVLTTTYLYKQGSQWADGPIIDMEYDISSHTQAPLGSGQIVIREFKPVGDVLQLVEFGAGHAIQVDSSGQAKAIYVDGQWVSNRGSFPHWVYGTRSELIYQQNGIVFWIVGDPRDGINEKVLMNIATSLHPLDLSRAAHKGINLNYTAQVVGSLLGPFSSDVVVVLPNDGDDNPYMSLVNPGQTAPEKPQKSVPHSL